MCGSARVDDYAAPTQITRVLKRNPFIIPSAPVLKRQPPTGPQWLHEVKFDGWRAQLHKAGDEVAIYTRKGHDYTKRFPAIRDSLLALPTVGNHRCRDCRVRQRRQAGLQGANCLKVS